MGLNYGCQVGAVLKNYGFIEGLERYLELAKEIELTSIELDLSHPDLFTDGLRPRILPWEINAQIKRFLRNYLNSFKIKGAHLPFSSMGLYSICDNEKIERVSRQKIKEAIKICGELGLDFVTIHICVRTSGVTFERLYEKYEEVLNDYLYYAENHNIILGIENTGIDLIILADIIKKRKNKYLKLVYDIGHAYPLIKVTEYRSLDKVILDLGNNIVDIHLHDHNIMRDHLPIGRGVINFKSIIHALLKVNYKGALNLEIDASDIEDIIKSISILRKYENSLKSST